MKKIILCIGLLSFLSFAIQAQTIKKLSSKRSSVTKVSHNKPDSKRLMADSPNVISLTSSDTDLAKSGTISTSSSLTISDPIVRSLNERANGGYSKIIKSGIVGMPKSAYGFANGHLTLSTSGSTTSGTQTGSGLVGTGTSLGTFGSTGPAMEVNGKSPYAGINMWGNARNLTILKPDSTTRVSHH